MARKKPTRSRRSSRKLPVGLVLRFFLYACGFIQILSAKGTALMPVAGGLTLALCVFALLTQGMREDDEGHLSPALAGIEAVLVSFVIYFAGANSVILLLPVLLATLIGVERGMQSAMIFALVNSVGWLGPTLMDKDLGHMNLLGVVYRVGILCAAPFVILAIPKIRLASDPEEQFARRQGQALETAQQAARSEGEVRAQREQELYNERRKLEALMQIAHRMAVLRDPDELLATIVACAREQLQVDVAVILLRRGQNLVVEWKEGFTDACASKLNCPVGKGLLGRLVQTGESFSYSQVDGVEPIRPYWPLHGLEQLIPLLRGQSQGYHPRSDDLRNFLVVPLQTPIDQSPTGLILLGNRLVGDRFSHHDQGYLQILATDAAISIRNLFFLAERERSHDEMIRALAQAIEAKDPYTSGHVTRVCSYSIRLAQAMGMAESFIKDLNTAAMLHDVGKISTPDHVLMKPGPLTDEEFAIMKQHVVHSARIIRDIRSVSPEIQRMVLYHHERFDGKGYPEGIRGDEIPIGAQIMSIADAYDAMTSHRPYRKGMEPAEAMKRLEQGAGTQFNAEVLSYFFALANYEVQPNGPLSLMVREAKQRVGANLLRTSAPGRVRGVSVSGEGPSDQGVQGSHGAPSTGPVRRGPERLDLDGKERGSTSGER